MSTENTPATVAEVQEMAKAAEKAVEKAPARRSTVAKTAKNTPKTAPKVEKDANVVMVQKRITAPARLEQIQKAKAEGKLPKNIAVSNPGGKFTAYEWVKDSK